MAFADHLDKNVGELIRSYRIEKGLSQTELEAGIGAAFGSLTKIESGKINPSKETLHKIIDCLHLPPISALGLFDINTSFLGTIIESLRSIKNVKDASKLMDIVLHDVRLQLGLAGGAFYLIEADRLCLKSLSVTNFMLLARKIVKDPLKMLCFNLNAHTENLLVQAVHTKKIVITDSLYDMVRPQMSKWMSDRAQKISLTKQIIGIPILIDNKVVGLITYGSLIGNDFKYELEPLTAFVAEIAIALQHIINKD